MKFTVRITDNSVRDYVGIVAKSSEHARAVIEGCEGEYERRFAADEIREITAEWYAEVLGSDT